MISKEENELLLHVRVFGCSFVIDVIEYSDLLFLQLPFGETQSLFQVQRATRAPQDPPRKLHSNR